VDGGVQLTHKIVESLSLTGWQSGPPLLPNYTPEEVNAINTELSGFQRMADEAMGGDAVFHPEVLDDIRRQSIAQALYNLAGNSWRFRKKKASRKLEEPRLQLSESLGLQFESFSTVGDG